MPPKVDKEVEFFLVSAGKQPADGDPNFFEKAKEAMTLIIEKKILLRPSDEVGIMIAAPHDDDIEKKDACTKLHCRNLVTTWDMVKDVQKLRASNKVFDDWNTALTETIEQIKETVIGHADRIIMILLFDCHDTCPDIGDIDVEATVQLLTKHGITLLWIGSKPLKDIPRKKLNESEKLLLEVIGQAGGEYMTIDKTLPSLRVFKNSKIRFMPWKSDLELGNLSIPISMYVQATRTMKAPSFKTIRTKVSDDAEKTIAAVPEREYVDRYKQSYPVEDTISGYMYGRQCIPVPEADKVGMKYESGVKSFKVYGFVPRNSISLEDLCGESSHIVVPQSPAAAKALYCLAQALTDVDRVAIVRRIYARNYCPKMGVLFPHIDLGEPWGFIHVEMLYAENRRVQVSRPLSSVINRVTNVKREAVGSLIDSMMLTGSADRAEPFRPGSVHSPGLQHLYNCLVHRALHPDKPVPEMDENLKKLVEPPESVKVDGERVMKKLRNLFPIPDEPVPTEDPKNTKPEVPVPVLCEVKKMETKIEEIDEPCALLPEESNVDLDELFDEDMAL